ncbi:TetR/AcrR family transcriptional regulator [Rhizobium sp. Root651]|uniref:TetR/AcrR family transcriptional regulator n=1 Tax=Rhizobium sp. Root651 TaxID=1736577 RepID=UPI000B20A936|nr:TetR/AcrR family transcriptional regulator [Rhizobium sp. Root651]
MLDGDPCRSQTGRPTPGEESLGMQATRVLSAAETLCTLYGIGKLNVCDIASHLGMSTANVYRFFPSKMALNDRLAAWILDSTFPAGHPEIEAAAAVGRAQMIQAFLLDLHRQTMVLMQEKRNLFALLAVADEGRWPAFEAHVTRVRDVIAAYVSAGGQTGAVPLTDSLHTAECLCAATAAIWEPRTLKHFPSRRTLITAEDLVAFSIEPLRHTRLALDR